MDYFLNSIPWYIVIILSFMLRNKKDKLMWANLKIQNLQDLTSKQSEDLNKYRYGPCKCRSKNKYL